MRIPQLTIVAVVAALGALALVGPATAGDAGVAKPDAGSVATSRPTAPVPIPTTPTEALEAGKDAVAAARSGNWWYFAALVVTILLFGVKFAGTKLGSWWVKLGRWRYVIPPVLSIAAALLAKFQGGVSAEAAIAVFTASWTTSSLQELWEHGIRGKPHGGSTS